MLCVSVPLLFQPWPAIVSTESCHTHCTQGCGDGPCARVCVGFFIRVKPFVKIKPVGLVLIGDWDTKGLVLGRIWTQRDRHSVGLGHKGTGTQGDLDTKGPALSGTWTQRDWYLGGLRHKGTDTHRDLDLSLIHI